MSSREERLARQEAEAQFVDFLLERAGEVEDREDLRRNRSLAMTAGRERLFLEQLHEMLHEVLQKKLPLPRAINKKARGKTKRILNVILSDTHYGSNLDPREVGHKYGPVEEARRTAAVVKQVAEYKLQYRDETELYVHLLGDLIQGQLHDMRDGLPLAEQVASAIRILAQAIRYLAINFPRGVTVFCTPGNHGRNTARHRERATNQKFDAIETMVYVGLQEAFHGSNRVKVVLQYSPEYYFDLLGATGLGTHGDTVINPGYPGKNVDAEKMAKQIDRINNARAKKGTPPLAVVMVGHVHIGTILYLPGGTVVFTNSCLIPPDPYAKSIGIFETACGQWIFESVEGHPVGDSRFIVVSEKDDVDASLDAIIKPYRGLDKAA